MSAKQEDIAHAINSVLHLCSIEFAVAKGREWGQRLGTYLSRKRDEEAQQDQYSEDSFTKQERQIFGIFRASQPFIDYALSIKDIDFKALELK